MGWKTPRYPPSQKVIWPARTSRCSLPPAPSATVGSSWLPSPRSTGIARQVPDRLAEGVAREHHLDLVSGDGGGGPLGTRGEGEAPKKRHSHGIHRILRLRQVVSDRAA